MEIEFLPPSLYPLPPPESALPLNSFTAHTNRKSNPQVLSPLRHSPQDGAPRRQPPGWSHARPQGLGLTLRQGRQDLGSAQETCLIPARGRRLTCTERPHSKTQVAKLSSTVDPRRSPGPWEHGSCLRSPWLLEVVPGFEPSSARSLTLSCTARRHPLEGALRLRAVS